MAFAAVVDVCLQLHSVRNVDLFHQGLYQLRFRAYQDTSEGPGGLPLAAAPKSSSDARANPSTPPPECIALVPYNLLPAPLRLDGGGDPLSARAPRPPTINKVDYHCVSPASIDPDTQTFFSRSFLVRYCDEEVALDEACCFRLEIDLCQPGAINAPVYLEVDLMFADSAPPGAQQQQGQQQQSRPAGDSGGSGAAVEGARTATATAGASQAPQIDAFVSPLCDEVPPVAAAKAPVERDANATGGPQQQDFISVSYQVYRLNSVVKGTLEALPIVFDEFHFAQCSATILSLLVDVRQRLRFVPSPLAYFPRHRAKRPPLSLTYGPAGTEEQRPTRYMPSSQPRLPRTFSDIIPPLRSVDHFIRDGYRSLPPPSVVPREPTNVQPHEQIPRDWIRRAEQIYAVYMEMLLQSLLRLMCVYRSLCQRCLNAKERAALGENNSDYGEVTLPGEHNVLILKPGAQPVLRRPSENEFQLTVLLARELDADEEDEEATRSTVVAHLPTLRSRLPERAVSADVAPLFTSDFFLLGGQISELWGKFCLLLPVLGTRSEHFLRLRSEQQTLQRWQTMVVREGAPASEMLMSTEGAIGEAHCKRADILRKSMMANLTEPAPITDLFLPAGPEMQPLIFEQRYSHGDGKPEDLNDDDDTAATEGESAKIKLERLVPQPCLSVPKPYAGVHLFILVHGFQGNSYDMRLFQNTISLACPGAVCLCSSANEENTEGNIDAMGVRLAHEIDKYISNWCKDSIIGRISFVCHSLGGVIARAALARLEPLYGKLHTYVSLSSPHLGYTCSANRLVDAGMWVLKKWRKSECLQQLTLSDHKNPRETFMYKLAVNSAAMGHFKHVCLLSSWQDQYVPYESARIEVSHKLGDENKLRTLYAEMASKILSRIKPENFTRLDVNFKIVEKSIDSLIGRAAHIQFLENQLLMRMLTLIWSDLFT